VQNLRMTFTPTPPDDLPTPEQLYDRGVVLFQAMSSYLAIQQEQNASVLASIADIYSRLPATSGGDSGVWEWTNALPVPAGGIFISVLGETNRTIELSDSDADGTAHTFAGVHIGDTIVLTDDPATPPATAFRQYVVSAVDHSPASWVKIDAVRVAIFGSQDTPTAGTRLRLLLG
jgi:hypothetical protein